MGIADLFSAVKKGVKKKSKKSKKDPELKSKKKKSEESAEESAESKSEEKISKKSEKKDEVKLETKAKMPKRINRSVGDVIKKFYVPRTNFGCLRSGGIISASSDIRKIIPSIEKNAVTKPIIDMLQKFQMDLDKYIFETQPSYSDPFTPILPDAAKKYFSVFETSFFKPIIPTIQKKLDENPNSIFYSELIKTLDEYLSRAGFFTPEMNLGDDAKEFLPFMETSTKTAEKKFLKGAIATIEQLPYILIYRNENKEDINLCVKGKMTVYK